MVKQHIGKFLFLVGNVVDTYQAFPYFTAPDHAFETYIAELARLYRQSNLDSRQIHAAAEIMQKSIDFISLAVPSTAAGKARFMDALADAREKVMHDAEAESFHKKAG